MWQTEGKSWYTYFGRKGGYWNYFDENWWDKQHDTGICETKNCSWKMLLKENINRISGRRPENFILLIPVHHS